ncbi:MAG: heavy-metal-associated domain-containing protein [Gemmatimonadaceae bacterium]
MKAELTKTTVRIDGMHCGSCVAAVSTALRRIPTVHVERAAVGEVTLVRDPHAAPYTALVAAVEHAGYRVVNGDGAAGG